MYVAAREAFLAIGASPQGGLLGNVNSPSDGPSARTSRGNRPLERTEGRVRQSQTGAATPGLIGPGPANVSGAARLVHGRSSVMLSLSGAPAPTPLRADWLHLHALNQLFSHRGVALTYTQARLPYKIDRKSVV